ncbi:MAG: YlmC/YmxH family sporulation protein [Firmicutes bacterium]|nr:YlmC/YmxH family sporulation protein [Bacillota bacterium]
MRWSELAGKDIINIENADRLGRVDDADLVLREDGSIESLIASSRGRWRNGLTIAWERVIKIGPEAMLVALPEGAAGARHGRGAPGDGVRVWAREAASAAGRGAEGAADERGAAAPAEPAPVVRVTARRDPPER